MELPKHFPKTKDFKKYAFIPMTGLIASGGHLIKKDVKDMFSIIRIFPRQLADFALDSNGALLRYTYVCNLKITKDVVYSSKGDIVSDTGNDYAAIVGKKLPYLVGDSLSFYFFVATPPNVITEFSAALYSQEDKDTIQLNKIPIINSKATVSKKFSKSGNYVIKYEFVAQHIKPKARPIRTPGNLRFTVKQPSS